jgi:type IV pilus assembly protein PilB
MSVPRVTVPQPAPTALDRPPRETRARLGDLLVRDGLITTAQLHEALTEKSKSGRRLGEVLIEKGWASTRSIGRALAEQHQLDFVDLADLEIDHETASRLSERFARRARVLPVRVLENGAILVAVADPTDVLASDDLRLALRTNVRLVVADASEIEHVVSQVFRTRVDVVGDVPTTAGEAGDDQLDDVREAAAVDSPAIRLVNSIISRAIEEGASDIHFQPQARNMIVRARIDGVTRPLAEVPRSLQSAVTTRLKIMGELDIAERRTPQDGRVPIRFGDRAMDLRMAVLPTTYGEQVVIRILNNAGTRLRIEDLGLSEHALAEFTRSVMQPFGAVVAVGPTGSGKTTTLYAALEMLNDEERVLATIEDPVEHQFAGVSQVEIQPKSGLTFARGLRTMLRSDPDVLLVGEIRDEETAKIAMQAALTGHLVLTTLHAPNAAGAIARLREMGVEPNLLATVVNCIISQRLVRRLCTRCRAAYEVGDAEREALGAVAGSTQVLYRAAGCSQCSNTGYRGRVAIYEVMPIHGQVRRSLGGTTEEIFAAAVEEGMTTLRDDAARLVAAGTSSLEEVRRVTGAGSL